MNIKQFVATYEGKLVDWDGKFGGQCTDLARQYWNEVTNIKQPKPVVGAKDFWTNYETDSSLNKNFDKIKNTPEGIPQEGDVLIWGENYGPFGHIAIALDGCTSRTMKAFSQNDPVGTLSKTRDYKSYKGVLGWFRPKKATQAPTESPTTEDCCKKVSEYLKVENSTDRIIESIQDREKRIVDLEKELTTCTTSQATKTEVIAKQSQTLMNLQAELAYCRDTLQKTELRVSHLSSENTRLIDVQKGQEELLEDYRRRYDANKKELDALRLDKQLPTTPWIRKIVDYFIALDKIKSR